MTVIYYRTVKLRRVCYTFAMDNRRIGWGVMPCPFRRFFVPISPPENEGMGIEEMLPGFTINGAKQLGIEDKKWIGLI